MKILPVLACLLVSIACQVQAVPSADSLVRLRGANAEATSLEPGEAGVLDKWKCNVVRIIIDADADAQPTDAAPLDAYQGALEKLRAFLPAARQHRINVIVALQKSYKRSFEPEYWNPDPDNVKARSYVVAFWRAFAKQYKAESAIIGYDVLDQPNDSSPGARVWQNELLPAAIGAIRESNKDVWVVIQPSPWGQPSGFNEMTPVKEARAIYGFKATQPGAYTSQPINGTGDDGKKLTYPGQMPAGGDQPDITYDRAALATTMQGAVDFATRTHKRVMVIEFNVARWAPGGDKWTGDMISIFEEHHWDWIYGVMFGYNGSNPTDAPDEPDRLTTDEGSHPSHQFEVMKDGWSKNGN